jgi:hypothetical protein
MDAIAVMASNSDFASFLRMRVMLMASFLVTNNPTFRNQKLPNSPELERGHSKSASLPNVHLSTYK